jgi:hypothetical protein
MTTVFFYLVCEAIGTAATPGLLCQPRVIVKMIVEKQMECTLAWETEVLGENLPQRHFCPSQNPTWLDPGLNSGRRGGKPATNRLSYGAAMTTVYTLFKPITILFFFLSLRVILWFPTSKVTACLISPDPKSASCSVRPICFWFSYQLGMSIMPQVILMSNTI